MLVSGHYDVYAKYLTISLVNYTSKNWNLKPKKEKKEIRVAKAKFQFFLFYLKMF